MDLKVKHKDNIVQGVGLSTSWFILTQSPTSYMSSDMCFGYSKCLKSHFDVKITSFGTLPEI